MVMIIAVVYNNSPELPELCGKDSTKSQASESRFPRGQWIAKVEFICRMPNTPTLVSHPTVWPAVFLKPLPALLCLHVMDTRLTNRSELSLGSEYQVASVWGLRTSPNTPLSRTCGHRKGTGGYDNSKSSSSSRSCSSTK